jgi:hypothetical protein
MLFCQPRDNQTSLPERRPRLCGQIRCREGVGSGSSRCRREEAVYECHVCRSAVSKAELLRYYAAHVFRLGFSACIGWSVQANGRLTRKVVPPRELDSISNHPLKSLIRSRIPASPTPPSVFALRKRSNKARAMPRPSSCNSIITTCRLRLRAMSTMEAPEWRCTFTSSPVIGTEPFQYRWVLPRTGAVNRGSPESPTL